MRVFVNGVPQRQANSISLAPSDACSYYADKLLLGTRYGDPDGDGEGYSPNYYYSNIGGYTYGEIMVYSGNIGGSRILQNYQSTKGRYFTGDGSLYSYK